MWMYPGTSCSDSSFSTELDDAEINAQIRWILLHGGQSQSWPQPDPFNGRGHQPLGESAQAHFRLIVSIFASLTHVHSYEGSWVCVQHPIGGHFA
jgi:hypothetical protein